MTKQAALYKIDCSEENVLNDFNCKEDEYSGITFLRERENYNKNIGQDPIARANTNTNDGGHTKWRFGFSTLAQYR